ncbi:MAG: tRNA pseudouridine(55) synthase TruB [Thermoleophilia bacterium]|nr:tRNA pseudouridine(55) synthase TruB [Thermoleophilia bacterium]
MSTTGSPRLTGLSRVVLVDKPPGWTSYDVIRQAKRDLGGKIGHAGTLDPFATGLLVVLLGQATRLSALFMDLPKEYLVTAQLGARSTTGDPTGVVEPTGGDPVGAGDILPVLDRFRGTFWQRVPMTSAVKVGGEALYRKAHRGEEVETPVREVTVYDFTLVDFDAEGQKATLIARTAKGTYVRTLVEDVGQALGVGAYAAALRRTRVGHLSVSDAIEPETLAGDVLSAPAVPAVLSLSAALGHLPRHDVDAQVAGRVANGGELEGGPAGLFRVYGPAGLLAVYRGPKGRARPMVVFPTPQD